MAHELYLTYQEYKSYGGELSETAFIPLEFKSRKRIDYLTDSRVQNMARRRQALYVCFDRHGVVGWQE